MSGKRSISCADTTLNGHACMMRRFRVSVTCFASECETRKSMEFPVVSTETTVYIIPSRLVVTDETLLSGIISVKAFPRFTPVPRRDTPPVINPAVSLPADRPGFNSHSMRSWKMRTRAFLPLVWEANPRIGMLTVFLSAVDEGGHTSILEGVSRGHAAESCGIPCPILGRRAMNPTAQIRRAKQPACQTSKEQP